MQHPELSFPAPPEGYSVHLAPHNRLVAWTTGLPIDDKRAILYLDEKMMVWRELDRHISEVGDEK